MNAIMREPVPGDRVGPYQLLRRLSVSGMGVVFLACFPPAAHGREPARVVRAAVKLLRATNAHDPQLRERFKREVAFSQRVPRFCTAPVLEADLDADLPWVATEYIDADTLKRRLETRGPLSGGELHRFALGTAVALSAIHESDVIHRDVKPSNVLLSPEGPRIIDFGIARDATEKESTFTQVQPGTPHYMAPEQVANQPVMTRAVDVFAWAGLVTAAAIGRPPFPSRDALGPQAVMAAIVRADPDLGDLGEPLRSVVTEALDKDPAARPSAAGLVWRLAGTGPRVDGARRRPRPAPAGTSPEHPPSRGWSRRRTLLALAGGVAAAAGGAAVTVRATRSATPSAVVLEGHGGTVDAVAVGQLAGAPIAVSASRSDNTIRVWHLASGEQIDRLPFADDLGLDHAFREVAVGQHRGSPVAVLGGSLSRPMHVWDLGSGESAELEFTTGGGTVYTQPVSSVATGDWEGGPVVVTGAWDQTARMWDLRDGRQIGVPVGTPLQRHRAPLPVAVSELDGSPIVVIGGSDGPSAWRPETGEQVTGPPADHRDNEVQALAVGALGGRPVILSGATDSVIRMWDPASGDSVGRLAGNNRVRAVAYGEVDGNPVVVSGGDDEIVRVWDLTDSERPKFTLAGHTGAIEAVAVSEVDGSPVAVSGGDRTVRVWPLG